MKTRTLWIAALGAALGLAIALTALRVRQRSTAADAPVPPDAIEEVLPAPALVTGDELSTLLQNEAREAELARAREEQQQQWEALRRSEELTTPIGGALRDAVVIEGALGQPPSLASDLLDLERVDSTAQERLPEPRSSAEVPD
jgi:hypothetical protein